MSPKVFIHCEKGCEETEDYVKEKCIISQIHEKTLGAYEMTPFDCLHKIPGSLSLGRDYTVIVTPLET